MTISDHDQRRKKKTRTIRALQKTTNQCCIQIDVERTRMSSISGSSSTCTVFVDAHTYAHRLNDRSNPGTSGLVCVLGLLTYQKKTQKKDTWRNTTRSPGRSTMELNSSSYTLLVVALTHMDLTAASVLVHQGSYVFLGRSCFWVAKHKLIRYCCTTTDKENKNR